MKKLLLILLSVLSVSLHAQTNYYVSGSSLNVRSEPTTSSSIQLKLQRYENIQVLDINNGWAKIESGQTKGFVSVDYIKKGKAEVTIVSTYRTGAICRDGTRSSATGRGACSHHGGVDHWLYKEDTKVNIIE